MKYITHLPARLFFIASVLFVIVLLFALTPVTGKLEAQPLAQATQAPTPTIEGDSPNKDFLDPINASNIDQMRLVGLTELGNSQRQ